MSLPEAVQRRHWTFELLIMSEDDFLHTTIPDTNMSALSALCL